MTPCNHAIVTDSYWTYRVATYVFVGTLVILSGSFYWERLQLIYQILAAISGMTLFAAQMRKSLSTERCATPNGKIAAQDRIAATENSPSIRS